MLRSKKPNEQERDKSEPKRISSTTAVTAPKLQSNKELLKQDPKVPSNKELLKQDPKVQSNKESLKQDPKVQSKKESLKLDSKVQSNKESEQDTKGWQTIPKPKGHSTLDYARWDRVEDDSSEEEEDDDDEESQPQYRFRLRTVGVRPVKWKGHLYTPQYRWLLWSPTSASEKNQILTGLKKGIWDALLGLSSPNSEN